MSGVDNGPHLREQHATDKYGTKFVEKAGKLQEKTQRHSGADDKKSPAGGFDDTPIPSAPPGYTIRITFHRAENLPFSDFPSFSTDPYIHAKFTTDLGKRHKQDPDLFLRTPTIHKNTEPTWETQWVIAHVPASGFFLKCRLYDEDPSDHDDRLGNVHVNVGHISEQWDGIHNQPYDLKKRMGSKRAYTFRRAAALLRRGIKMNARLFVSVENLGRSPGDGGRSYTVAPLTWCRHNSPLIGRIAGTKDREESKDGKKSIERYNFQAIQMQLRGPVPAPLYHRYVEFRPFVAGMFTDATIRGRILNRALHHQHARIYNYDTSTVYGIFEKPCIEMTKQFLEFVHYDQGGRIFTYVLSLDGLWRFTETGKEYGIDLLSKHTMHSDVSIYIAFSGEFFIRRLKHPRRSHKSNDSSAGTDSNEIALPGVDHENDDHHHDGEHSHNDIPKDPSWYELIIDNDSGTYRPNADLLPLLKSYMSQNLPGLKVATLDCQKDEEKMNKLKKEQRERKKASGKQITYIQNSSMSSLSSSDEEELDARADEEPREHGYKKRIEKLGHKNNKHNISNQPQGHNETLSPQDALPDDRHDDRDDTSRSSSYRGPSFDHDSEPTTPEGYANKDLPMLLKKPDHVPESEREEQVPSDGKYSGYGEPETGDNKPAGGIAYNIVVSTAGIDKKDQKERGKKEKEVTSKS
ncbi:hypothetical protein H2198_001431 [Neophaeococcomyces mojaviensis]|uniref:Uncharacterized protein n=1 Tax=Neophaeococcomyces mojaviensis TaxID=3383035 RepID=A0ACC3AHG1_9EURO|nr:hypothetical protein H2198_001431 [Knufia sp. JES_112]